MDEKAALRALKEGSETALAYFIDLYSRYVATIADNIIGSIMSEADVEEVSADVFFTLWRNAEKIKPGKVKAYLGAIARNKAREKTRSMGAELPLEEDALIIFPGDMHRDLEARELERCLKRAVCAMKYPEREIFLRHYYYFQPLSQIAGEMEINLSTVKTKLRRGRERLKEVLNEGGYELGD